MLICDKCGKKIMRSEKVTSRNLAFFTSSDNYINHTVDLCDDCNYNLIHYLNKAESYFMLETNPHRLFDKVKYWDNKNL